MPSFQDILNRVLNLEIEKNYKNSAVAGGLNKFIPFIQDKGKSTFLSQASLSSITSAFNIYAELSEENRKEIINDILVLLENPSQERIDRINYLINTFEIKKSEYSTSNQAIQSQNLFLSDIQKIWGIGTQNSKKYNKLGILTIKDLLYFFPRKYQDFSQLKPIAQVLYGDEITIIGTLLNDPYTRPAKRGNLKITEVALGDSTGVIKLTWFNRPYINTQLRKDMVIVVSGKVDQFMGKLIINNPEWEPSDRDQINTNRIVPIYPLTSGITQRQIRKVINHNINFWAGKIQEFISKDILEEDNLLTINKAIQQIHFPETMDLLDKARQRFSFEEILFLQLGVMIQKTGWQLTMGKKYPFSQSLINQRIELLPFSLTSAQVKVIHEILADLNSGRPMNRLIQGDVGSGKTIVARFAIEAVTSHGKQAALMAPTSILAEQHFQTMTEWLIGSNIYSKDEIALLIGSTPKKDRNRILKDLKNGQIKLIIGTHALIEDPVMFSSLQLVVIDEQHRFGVSQRNQLRQKGEDIHLLVMTATPIPRSLALTIYGDLDVSIIDEMPIGRQKVITTILSPKNRNEAYQLIKSEMNKGNQAFIVYPKIESDEEEDYQSAVNEYERLRTDVFPDNSIGLLHGRLNPVEKDTIMYAFRKKDFQVLVATTVIEVGLDIPYATIVMIEGANRFGLAQLHQIRGRVGRGKDKSFCLLIPEDDADYDNERLQVMIQTNDGFKLAEQDLRQRGPGEFIGTRQSGFSGLRMANFFDIKMIEKARTYAKFLLSSDPLLNDPKNALVKEQLFWYWPELRYSMNMRGE